jgi:acetolactate synthase-1/2/3 large subunit
MTKPASQISFAEDLASEFANAGIRDAFVVTGGAIAPLTSALASQGRIKLHYMLTEQSAGIAAESYGYTDGKPALLIVTSGPGVTNALTPVAAAWTNSAPIIVVSGQARSIDVAVSRVSDLRQVGNQHVKTELIVDSIVKFFFEPSTPVGAKNLVSTLLSESVEGRQGPVWLSLPQDIQRAPSSNIDAAIRPGSRTTSGNVKELEASILAGLSKAKQPAILLGAGSRTIATQVITFAETFKIPILTTWPAMDLIPSDHDMNCGKPGAIPSAWLPNFVNYETDFFLILGARLDVGQVAYNPNTFAPNAKVIRVDVDSSEFERIEPRDNWQNFDIDLSTTEAVFRSLINSVKIQDLSEWWAQIHQWRANYPVAGSIPQELGEAISTYSLLSEASSAFPLSTIVTGSSGTCVEMLLQSWHTKHGQRIINSCGIGSMGFALPAAYGVAQKLNLNEILCIESDGSFAMNIQDLTQLIHDKTSYKIIVLDSSGYKSIGLSQSRLSQHSHGHNEDTGLSLPNIESLASSIGFQTKTIDLHREISGGIEWLAEQASSSILIAKVSSKEEAIPRLISKPNPQGIMVTPKMTELWPNLRNN